MKLFKNNDISLDLDETNVSSVISFSDLFPNEGSINSSPRNSLKKGLSREFILTHWKFYSVFKKNEIWCLGVSSPSNLSFERATAIFIYYVGSIIYFSYHGGAKKAHNFMYIWEIQFTFYAGAKIVDNFMALEQKLLHILSKSKKWFISNLNKKCFSYYAGQKNVCHFLQKKNVLSYIMLEQKKVRHFMPEQKNASHIMQQHLF